MLNGFIGSIRRDCLDQVIALNKHHLRWLLSSYLEYYHQSRTHLSLGKDCPAPRLVQPPNQGNITALSQRSADFIIATSSLLPDEPTRWCSICRALLFRRSVKLLPWNRGLCAVAARVGR
jgi:hypothetical protein